MKTLKRNFEFAETDGMYFIREKQKDYSWIVGIWLMGLLVVAIWLSIK